MGSLQPVGESGSEKGGEKGTEGKGEGARISAYFSGDPTGSENKTG
jgi:hypothetical protein